MSRRAGGAARSRKEGVRARNFGVEDAGAIFKSCEAASPAPAPQFDVYMVLHKFRASAGTARAGKAPNGATFQISQFWRGAKQTAALRAATGSSFSGTISSRIPCLRDTKRPGSGRKTGRNELLISPSDDVTFGCSVTAF